MHLAELSKIVTFERSYIGHKNYTHPKQISNSYGNVYGFEIKYGK